MPCMGVCQFGSVFLFPFGFEVGCGFDYIYSHDQCPSFYFNPILNSETKS